jgi:hypothetical protein
MDPVAAAAASRPTTPVPASGRVPWPARLALRSVVTLFALAVFAQAVLAGRFLSGDFLMLDAHLINSQVVGAIGIAQVVAAVLYWRPGGGPGWPALACLGLFVALPAQIATGLLRIVGVHVPLAVVITVAAALLLTWAWRPSFGRRRATARSTR